MGKLAHTKKKNAKKRAREIDPLDPRLVMKVRDLFKNGGIVDFDDFRQFPVIRECIRQLVLDGLLFEYEGKCSKFPYDVYPPPAATFGHPTNLRLPEPKPVCPWCNKPARRHSRSEIQGQKFTIQTSVSATWSH